MADEQRDGVALDPSNPDDRRIIKRQQQAARQAGREGRDRGRTTRGRADLEAAYDQGAAAARDENGDQADEDQADGEESAPRSAGARVKAAGGKAVGAAKTAAKGVNKAGKPLSKGRWRPTLRPPTRLRDGGSLLTGALLYTAAITYIRYGPDGWKGWLAAKFLNKPMAGPPPSALGNDSSSGKAGLV
jgi:hypothetical protein